MTMVTSSANSRETSEADIDSSSFSKGVSMVYDRICKDAPTLIVNYLKSLCEKADPSIFLQAVSNCSQWILNCEKRSYLFGLDSVSDADDVKDRWFSQSDFDSIYDDVQGSKYPVEVREWVCCQLSYILQD